MQKPGTRDACSSSKAIALRVYTADGWYGRAVIGGGSSGVVQDLACVLRVLRADHDVVRPHGAEPVSSPGPAVRQPGQALDAATQDRAEQLGLGLATGDPD
jgi:hypothetical protein